MLRKLVIFGVVAVGGILVGGAKDFRTYFGSAVQNHTKTLDVLSSTEYPSSQKETKIQLTGRRLFAWSLFILLLPVVTAPLANRLLDKQSNTANLLLLFGYTGLDIVAAYRVGGFSVEGILSAIVYLIALLAVFSYNLWICAFLARLRQA